MDRQYWTSGFIASLGAGPRQPATTDLRQGPEAKARRGSAARKAHQHGQRKNEADGCKSKVGLLAKSAEKKPEREQDQRWGRAVRE